MLDATQLAPLDPGPRQDLPAYDGAIDALLRDTARNLVVASGLFWLGASLLTTINWGGDRLPGLLLCLLVVTSLFMLAYRLSQRSYRTAMATWMAGMLVAVFGSAWLLGNPNVILIAAVLPLLAAVAGGGVAGIAMELILIVLAGLVSRTAVPSTSSTEAGPFDDDGTASRYPRILLAGSRCPLKTGRPYAGSRRHPHGRRPARHHDRRSREGRVRPDDHECTCVGHRRRTRHVWTRHALGPGLPARRLRARR